MLANLQMKQTTTTLYCDATGRPIENRFEMCIISLRFSGEKLDVSDTQIYLSESAHQLPYERLIANDYTAYVSQSGTTAMIKEASTSRTTFYDSTTAPEPIRSLFQTIDWNVLPQSHQHR